ncbi:Hypothetical protein UVM_LOCUS213, partial [uncultured virus]
VHQDQRTHVVDIRISARTAYTQEAPAAGFGRHHSTISVAKIDVGSAGDIDGERRSALLPRRRLEVYVFQHAVFAGFRQAQPARAEIARENDSSSVFGYSFAANLAQLGTGATQAYEVPRLIDSV